MATDPWALLREARECVICPFAYRQTMYCACTFCALKKRIDAALAERQDSAKDVVESEPVDWGPPDRFQIAHVGAFVAEVFPDRDDKGWVWAIEQRDNANTEAEAKSAAIAAARGMR